MIWFSERSNWGQLYLYDLQTGRLKNAVTTGEGNVSETLRVDEKNRMVYFLGVGKEIKRETVLFDALGNLIGRVDFFRKSIGEGDYWDIIELKGPQDLIVAGAESAHPHIANRAVAAIRQANDYRTLIDENPQIRARLLAQGIKVRRPKLLIVAGRRNPGCAGRGIDGVRPGRFTCQFR